MIHQKHWDGGIFRSIPAQFSSLFMRIQFNLTRWVLDLQTVCIAPQLLPVLPKYPQPRILRISFRVLVAWRTGWRRFWSPQGFICFALFLVFSIARLNVSDMLAMILTKGWPGACWTTAGQFFNIEERGPRSSWLGGYYKVNCFLPFASLLMMNLVFSCCFLFLYFLFCKCRWQGMQLKEVKLGRRCHFMFLIYLSALIKIDSSWTSFKAEAF